MSKQAKPQYTEEVLECPHCSNRSPMEIIADAGKIDGDENDVCFYHRWKLFLCPNCRESLLLYEGHFSEDLDYYYDHHGQTVIEPIIEKQTLYPYSRNFHGIPKDIDKLYRVAKRLIPIDSGSALVKIRQLLEAVCADKKAVGKDLFGKLEYLSKQGVIPASLYKIADELRKIGNLGAHHKSSESDITITKEDAILAQKLCETILEYVYEAPAMLTDLEQRLDQLKP